MTTLLTAHDIRQIVSRVGLHTVMDETIQRLTTALREFDSEKTQVAVRDGFTYKDPHIGLLEAMSILDLGGRATIKMVGYHPSNPTSRGLPTILSTIEVFDATTGHLVGLMDGTFLTAVRTAAASAVASRVLAHPESRILGLVGCGAQAVTQLHALSRVFDIRQVLAYDIDPTQSGSLAERASVILPADTIIEETPLAEIVARSDILCTQTSVDVGEGPVFQDGETKPHLHVNAVGADFPNKTELPLPLLKRSFVCPDFPDQTALEGECQRLTAAEIGPSLVEVVKDADRFRHVQEQPSVFDSTGFALEDHVAARLFFDYARDFRLGTAVEFECKAEDPWNPYGFLKP